LSRTSGEPFGPRSSSVCRPCTGSARRWLCVVPAPCGAGSTQDWRPRGNAPCHDADMNTLGPVVHDLGSIRRTSIGRKTFGVTIALGIVGVLFMILGLAVAFAGTRFADAVLAIALASILLVPGLLVMAFAIAMMIQLQRTRAVIHEHGLDLGQSWF